MTTRHCFPALLAICAASVGIAACGGSSGGGGSSGRPDDTKELAFAKCLRKAGIDAQDPQINGGKITQRVRLPEGISETRMRQITADCARKTGGGPKPLSREDRARFLDAALKFARCMRAHGVDVPDPRAGQDGIMIQKGGGDGSAGGGPDPSSPAFQRAQKSCESYLPGGKGGGAVNDQRSGGKGSGPSLQMQSGER